MPGYVIHMAVGCEIIRRSGHKLIENSDRFLQGTLIPDVMPRTEKKESHFWDDETYKNLNRIPNLDEFICEYGDRLDDPFVLGYYTHLYLDNLFVKEYWSEHFELLDVDMQPECGYDKVAYFKVKNTGNVYSREDFLSDRLYYGDYDRLNPYIFEKYSIFGVSDDILDIPVRQIYGKEYVSVLKTMINKIKHFYDSRDSMPRKKLMVFELEDIYNLMDKVISDICSMIK